jgi:hypothetical protein
LVYENKEIIVNIKKFQDIAATLLHKHFGMGLTDTDLTEEAVVSQHMQWGHAPHEVVNAIAADADLARIDVRGVWGIPQFIALTPEDEKAASALAVSILLEPELECA